MALVDLEVLDVIKEYAEKTDRKNAWGEYSHVWKYRKNKYFKMKPEHTYMIVFGPDQDEAMSIFEKHYSKYVIFKSKKAMNTNHSDGYEARNTLFIFEK